MTRMLVNLCLFLVLWAGSARGADLVVPVENVTQLESKANELDRRGQLDTYGRMRQLLIRRFAANLKIDIDKKHDDLARMASRDLERLISEEGARLTALAQGSAGRMSSPRRVRTEKPGVVGDHLEQTVEWPDGRKERRPVFLFGFGNFGDMQRDIGFLGSLGCNYCQTHLTPAHVLAFEGKWNEKEVADTRAFLRNAAAAGVLVDLLLGPHYVPDWFFQRHPEWNVNLGGFVKYPINQPGTRRIIGSALERIVAELKAEPAFWSCCIANEPAFFLWDRDPDTKALWVRYLKGKYKTLDDLNEEWKTSYRSWSAVPAYLTPPGRPYKPEPALYDWMRFNDRRAAEWIAWLQDRVRAADAGKLTHVKQLTRYFDQFEVFQASDPDQFSRITDLAGMDLSCYPKDVAGDDERAVAPVELFLAQSLLKNASGKPLLNTENHLLRDQNADEILPGHVRAVLWCQALAGLDGSVAWAWDRDDSPPPGGPFQGLWQYRPGATEEYVRTGLDLMRVMPEVVALRSSPVKVVVLYSRTSMLRDPKAPQILFDTYQTLLEMGLPIEAVTEQMVAAGELRKRFPEVRVIVLPGCTHMPEETFTGLDTLAQEQVTLIGVGKNVAAFDAYGRRRNLRRLADTGVAYVRLPQPDFDKILQILAGRDARPAVALVDPQNSRPVRGVIYRTAAYRGRLIATAVNLTRKPVPVKWREMGSTDLRFTDALSLSSGKDTSAGVIRPLEVQFGVLSKDRR